MLQIIINCPPSWASLEMCSWATMAEPPPQVLSSFLVLFWPFAFVGSDSGTYHGTLSPAPQKFPQLLEFTRACGKPPGQQCIKNNTL